MVRLTRASPGALIGAVLVALFTLQPPTAAKAADAKASIEVKIDEATLVHLDRQSAEVIIGNPSIADVAVQNGRLLVVTGKSFGVTNLIVIDEKGKQILSKTVSVGMDDSRYVTVHTGRDRASYHCAPTCQTALIPGDASEHFEGMSKELRGKIGIAQSALDGGGQAPQ